MQCALCKCVCHLVCATFDKLCNHDNGQVLYTTCNRLVPWLCLKSFVYFLPMPSDKGYKAWPACVLGATDWQCHRHDCEITVLAKFKQLKKIYIHSAFFCSPSPPLHDINLLCKSAEIRPQLLLIFVNAVPPVCEVQAWQSAIKLAKLQWQCIVILAKTSYTL